MTEMTELERRLADALYRIEAAVARLPDPTEAGNERMQLESQLADERSTNAQLIERVQALKERQENHVAQLEASLETVRAANAEKAEIQQELKDTIEGLRDQIARLTEANRAMVGDPELVNTSMMVELEAMRATRAADAAEVDEILAMLEPPRGGHAHA